MNNEKKHRVKHYYDPKYHKHIHFTRNLDENLETNKSISLNNEYMKNVLSEEDGLEFQLNEEALRENEFKKQRKRLLKTLHKAIDYEFFSSLTPKEEAVFKGYYKYGISQLLLGKWLGVSQSRIAQLFYQVGQKLKKKISP